MKAQKIALNDLLAGARRLYNVALEQRRWMWRDHGISVGYYDQASQLKEARDADPKLGLLNYSACQGILRRLQKSFDAFFRRIKSGEKPGYPRFKNAGRFNSITFPAYGDGVRLSDKLYVQNVGWIKIKLHRPLEGKAKTVTLLREGGQWYAVFSCDQVEPALWHPASDRDVGLDMGLASFATLSTGEKIGNPRWYRKTEEMLQRAQRELSRKKKGSHRRLKAKERVAKYHARAAHKRRDFHHKLAKRLVSEHSLIAVEDLGVSEMLPDAQPGMAKSIQDASWGRFLSILSAKAVEAGRTFVRVPPEGTSSTCFGCGAYRKKALSEREHRCPCGLVLDRDLHASLNILRLGRSLQRRIG